MTRTRKPQDCSFLKRRIVLHAVLILLKFLMRFSKTFHFPFFPMELPLNISNIYHSQKEHIISVHKLHFCMSRMEVTGRWFTHTRAQAQNILTAHLGRVSKKIYLKICNNLHGWFGNENNLALNTGVLLLLSSQQKCQSRGWDLRCFHPFFFSFQLPFLIEWTMFLQVKYPALPVGQQITWRKCANICDTTMFYPATTHCQIFSVQPPKIKRIKM